MVVGFYVTDGLLLYNTWMVPVSSSAWNVVSTSSTSSTIVSSILQIVRFILYFMYVFSLPDAMVWVSYWCMWFIYRPLFAVRLFVCPLLLQKVRLWNRCLYWHQELVDNCFKKIILKSNLLLPSWKSIFIVYSGTD